MNPHANTPTLYGGAPIDAAKAAIVLLHGRGGSAEDILTLGPVIAPEGVAFVAPQAASHTWYPQSFLAPRQANEPYLSSALARVKSEVEKLVEQGIARERIFVAGFSQGACLSSEFVASNPARYAGLIAFTGGLVGPLDSDLTHVGSLAGMPALLLSGDPDPHVPWARVESTKKVLEGMGAVVQAHRYPGRPHTVTGEEVALAKQFVKLALG
ncbi:alpha/beta hydrolase [Granulicella cerasi]|uniref:Alpha/beta hydrolase n=1 Tax=Granulicella cerasi TaxID=741063 RepID=A0ABW1ZC40_9BACT|nr:dienelactone hydrolase family protein [Granulicella cerasi]